MSSCRVYGCLFQSGATRPPGRMRCFALLRTIRRRFKIVYCILYRILWWYYIYLLSNLELIYMLYLKEQDILYCAARLAYYMADAPRSLLLACSSSMLIVHSSYYLLCMMRLRSSLLACLLLGALSSVHYHISYILDYRLLCILYTTDNDCF